MIAIESVIDRKMDEKLEQKLAPLREELNSLRKLFTTVVNIQVDILDKLELLDGHIKLIMYHLNLSPESRELKKKVEAMR